MEMMSTSEDDDNNNGIQIHFQSQNGALNDSNFAKPIHASYLREHIQHLLDAKDPNYPEVNGFDVEFNYIETQTAQEQYFGDYKTALINTNKNKNRYSNVLPPEKTRVKIKVEEGDENASDFINANFISGLIPNSETAYVATQGPLQSTFGDFWKMVWQVDAVVIIMLTKEVENGKLKCDRYWPDYDCPMNASTFKITLESQDDSNSELTTRKFKLYNTQLDESREIWQFQYTAWPDHCLPVSTSAFLDLAHKADTANTTNGPIIVHCSAGIGRSGTFCTVHSIVEKLRLDIETNPDKDPEFNIVKTVLFMRQQRPGMVQTREQYMFCYLTLLEECERLFSSKQKAKKVAKNTLDEVADKTNTEESSSSKPTNPSKSEDKKLNDNQPLFSLSSSMSDDATKHQQPPPQPSHNLIKSDENSNTTDLSRTASNPFEISEGSDLSKQQKQEQLEQQKKEESSEVKTNLIEF